MISERPLLPQTDLQVFAPTEVSHPEQGHWEPQTPIYGAWTEARRNYFPNPGATGSFRFSSYAGTNGNVRADSNVTGVSWALSGAARRVTWTAAPTNNADMGIIVGAQNGSTPVVANENWTVEYDLAVSRTTTVTVPTVYSGTGSRTTVARSHDEASTLTAEVPQHRWATFRGDATALNDSLRVIQTMQGKQNNDWMQISNVMLYPGNRVAATHFDGSSPSGDVKRYRWLDGENASASVEETRTRTNRPDKWVVDQPAYTEIVNAWRALTPDTTGIKVRRGGRREGLGLRTDVGLMTFSLLNAEDPMDGGSLKPGQPVRMFSGARIEHPAVPIRTSAPEERDWVAASGSNIISTPGAWQYSNLWRTDTQNARATATISGLTPGRSYTFRGRIKTFQGTPPGWVQFGAVGIGRTDQLPTTGVFRSVSYNFTATSGTHTLEIIGGGQTGATDLEWYSLDLTQDAWVEDTREVVFTGRIAFLKSAYPLDKATGKSRAVTEVTVADAVQIHGSTMRYGVDLGTAEFETFEARIQRLAVSSNAPIETPDVGAPKQVYAL